MVHKPQLTLIALSALGLPLSLAAEKENLLPRFNLKDSTKLADTLKSRLAINDRTYGPFGKNQDPNAKPAPVIADKPEITTPVKKDPKILLKNEIDKLKKKVSAYGNNMAIINGKTYVVGSTLKLAAKDENTGKTQTFVVQLAKVTQNTLIFRDTKGGGHHMLNLGKAGVLQPGDAPKLDNDDDDEVINLDD